MAGSTVTTSSTTLQRTIADDPNSSVSSPMDLGWIRKDEDRLSVLAQLSKYDKDQVFKANVLTNGKLFLGESSDSPVRIQVMSAGGQVIADSKAGMGKASDNYQSLRAGTFAVKAGQYLIKVQRDSSVPPQKVVNYGVQLKMGTYTKDYAVKVTPPSRDYALSQIKGQSDPSASIIANGTYNSLLGSSSMSGLFGLLSQ